MTLKFLVFFEILFFGISNVTYAQYGFPFEIGVIAVPVTFRSDFGELYDLSINAGNTRRGIGLIHYFKFLLRS